jgi:tRNA-modifying protein YgfZ
MQPSPAAGSGESAAPPIGRGTWLGPPDAIAAALSRPSFAALDEIGTIVVEGADATAFLHAQLTNDARALAPQRAQLDGYCTAKGRLLAIFLHVRFGESHLLLAPAELVAGLVRRLSTYVLRAKVRIHDASTQWAVYGVFGRGAGSGAPFPGLAMPTQDWDLSASPEALLVRLPAATGGVDRLLLAAQRPAVEALVAHAAHAGLSPSASTAWWSAQVDAGEPAIFAATQERYIPQMLNLDALGGVNFKKGCYPGQEVVARTQYLGKLRRHLSIGNCAQARIGDDVFEDGKSDPIGSVVLAATAPGGGVDLLFESTDPAAGAALRVGSAGGPPLHARNVPNAGPGAA